MQLRYRFRKNLATLWRCFKGITRRNTSVLARNTRHATQQSPFPFLITLDTAALPPSEYWWKERGGQWWVRARANASIISFQFVAGARQVGGGMPTIPRRRPVIEEQSLPPTRISVLDIEFRSIEWVVELQTAPSTHRRRNNYAVCLQSSFFFSLFSENRSNEFRAESSPCREVRKLKIISKWAGNLFQITRSNHIH